MRIAKILGWATAGLLFLAVVLIVILLTLELDTYRGPLQSELSSRIGRPVTLAGDMSMEVSLWPTIVVEDIAVGNPSWASRPEFARAERLRVQLTLLPLLRGHVEILELALEGADVLFERNLDGAKNWIFGKGEAGALVLPEIDSLTCDRCVLGYRQPSGEERRLNVSAVSAVLDIGEPIQLLATATYRDTAFSVSLLGGTPETLIQADTPWPIKLKVRAGGATVEIEGAATRPLEAKDFDLWVRARGEQLADLANFFDITPPALGAYRLSGRVTEAGGKYNVTEVAVRLGNPGLPGYFIVTDATASFGYDRPIEVKAAGAYNDLSFSTSLTGGTVAELISPTGLWPIKLSTRAGGAVFSIDGILARPLSAQAYELQVKIAGPGGTDLERLARLNLPPLGPYSLACRVQVRDGDYSISALKGFIDSADAATRLTVADGRASAAADTPVSLEVKGTYLDAPFAIAFQGGTLAGLLAPVKPWPIKLTVNTLGSDADVTGSVARPLEGKGIDLRAKASGPHLYRLRRLFGAPLPHLGSYALSGRVVDSEDGYSATNVKVKVDAGELRGNVAFKWRKHRPYLSIQVTSEALDLSKLIQAEGDAAIPAAPVPWDVPIALPLLRAVDADIDLHIKRITRGPVEIGDYTVTTRLRDGQLAVRPLRVRLPGASVEGELELDVSADTPVLRADLTASKVDVGTVWKEFTEADSLRGMADAVSVKISGSGPTIRALLPQASLRLTAGSGYFEYRSAQKETHRIELSELDVRIDDGSPIAFSVQGTFRDTPYRATFTGVRLAHLLAGDTHWPVSVSAHAAGASLMAKGTLTWPLGSPGWDLVFSLQGQRLDALNAMLGAQLPALGPYELGARLDRNNTAYRLSDLEVRVDDNHATGSLEFAAAGPGTRITANLVADELDLDDWIKWLHPDKEKKAATQDKEFVFTSFDIPVDRLRRTDLQLQLEITKIKARGADFGNVRARVQAANGRLIMVPFKASMAGGEISATLQIDATANTPSSLAQLSVRHLDYGRWLKALQVTDTVEGIVDVEVTLRGRGATLRDMLGDADGAALFVSGPARISGSGLDLWGAGLTSGLMSITTMAVGIERSTPFNCMVWPINVTQGVARSDAILIDTPKITVTGTGTLNFATEELDLLLRPARKQASLFSLDNPVRLSGTLANPKRTVVGKLGTLGRILLPFINPAFLLLSADIGTGKTNVCVHALADADQKAVAANKQTNVRGEARDLLRILQRPTEPSSRQGSQTDTGQHATPEQGGTPGPLQSDR